MYIKILISDIFTSAMGDERLILTRILLAFFILRKSGSKIGILIILVLYLTIKNQMGQKIQKTGKNVLP